MYAVPVHTCLCINKLKVSFFPQNDSPQVSPVPPSSPEEDSLEKEEKSSRYVILGIVWKINVERSGGDVNVKIRHNAHVEINLRGSRDKTTWLTVSTHKTAHDAKFSS